MKKKLKNQIIIKYNLNNDYKTIQKKLRIRDI